MNTMHYSEVLRSEINRKNDLLDLLSEELTNTLAYLCSSKFQGFENNYVNAQEMANRILEIRSLILAKY
jgi:hypothetical protein